jgi:UDP-N-acetylglucosamine:LPS N-acetylglucosamine transferase
MGLFVLALCGRNEAKHSYFEHVFAGDPNVRVLGFVDHMATLLSASDVLVHSTAGLTVLEAHVVAVIGIGLEIVTVAARFTLFKRRGWF